ncbi:hypothetical protein PHLCEN_2v12920 [Hermanssonia centrifuga]|uniref:Uncharacterized protein n=1 Tax=Hermanssonia centrifuga TaxID=98765 RepID=A0A2R6NFZ8_9APHY|nr:hypothetical protein PHLCEN_2v12920 [Hermanssonia centrifuga]
MVIYLVGLQRTMDDTTFQDQDPKTTTTLPDGQLTSVVINTLGTASDVCQTEEHWV